MISFLVNGKPACADTLIEWHKIKGSISNFILNLTMGLFYRNMNDLFGCVFNIKLHNVVIYCLKIGFLKLKKGIQKVFYVFCK